MELLNKLYNETKRRSNLCNEKYIFRDIANLFNLYLNLFTRFKAVS